MFTLLGISTSQSSQDPHQPLFVLMLALLWQSDSKTQSGGWLPLNVWKLTTLDPTWYKRLCCRCNVWTSPKPRIECA